MSAVAMTKLFLYSTETLGRALTRDMLEMASHREEKNR